MELNNHHSIDPMIATIEEINRNDTDKNGIKITNMQGLNSEFAQSNKWYGYFPLANVLGKGYSNLELNLTRFSIPQMVMGSSSTQFKGYTYTFPTHLLDADEKEITIEYIVDSKWQNYRSLFKWCCAAEGQINKVIDTNDVDKITNSDFITCRIYLLDHFKNKIISFSFHNCWVKIFQDLALESNNSDEVNHSITLAYSNYTIDDI